MKINKKYIKRVIWLAPLIIYLILLYNWNFTGSRWGKVVDAATGKPIEGAVVCMRWFRPQFFGICGGHEAAIYETLTNKNGEYYIPNQLCDNFVWLGVFEGYDHEIVLVYKDGYCAYKVDEYGEVIIFGAEVLGEIYRSKGNLVKLQPFHGSHAEHRNWIVVSYRIYDWPKQLIEKELEAEIKRAKNERY
ncbi:MAG: carboxypeptidase regulatory-like domain-containing protein [Sedimentisphaerales bacterium]|nr:carboxypeptidase regulatory-like domain-containing protein [Sedimentisphaerales bacterium]MBN2843007.1 carboxypeptidase regulatory-like domain-containing protein [Sedimentisphaerales bacterium]